eukprot:1176569-Prymnesium_polylepis.1
MQQGVLDAKEGAALCAECLFRPLADGAVTSYAAVLPPARLFAKFSVEPRHETISDRAVVVRVHRTDKHDGEDGEYGAQHRIFAHLLSFLQEGHRPPIPLDSPLLHICPILALHEQDGIVNSCSTQEKQGICWAWGR